MLSGLRLRAAAVLLALLLLSTSGEAQAQVQWLDDVARAGRRAGEIATVSGGPPSEAVRAARGLSLLKAASMTLERSPARAGRLRAYLGLQHQRPALVLDGKAIPLADSSLQADLSSLLTSTRRRTPEASGFDLYVESDLLAAASFRGSTLPPDVDLYLANLDGPSWKAEAIDTADGPAYRAVVEPSLHVRIDAPGTAMEHFQAIRGLRFQRGDVRVLSFFDPEADLDTFDAIVKATGSTDTPVHHVADPDIARHLERASGKIVVVLGHVEADQLVLRRAHGEAALRFGIADLEALAAEHDLSLLVLGCETARLPVSGFEGVAHSLDVAQQLETALQATTYADFLGALGNADVPLVIEASAASRAQIVIAARLERDQAAQAAGAGLAGRATITSARLTTRAPQAAGLPSWWRWVEWALLALLGVPIGLGVAFGWWFPARLLLRLAPRVVFGPLALFAHWRRRPAGQGQIAREVGP